MMTMLTRCVCTTLALAGSAVAESRALDAEIRWTQYGVPHVKAADYASLGFGYGYAVATDELCVLADLVVTLRGERSRWFGPDEAAPLGVSNLNSDLFYRVQLSDAELAAAKETLSPNAKELVRGYAAGYNRFVHDMKPAAREAGCNSVALMTMTGDDVIKFTMQINSLWRAFDIASAASTSTWESLVAPTSSAGRAEAHARLTTHDGEDPIGSNAWAYGSNLTGSGAAMVVANPHTSWLPSWQRMHQLHLTIPGEIDVAGADFAGLPVPVAGFTRDLAWSIKSPMGVRYHLLLALDVRGGSKPVHMVDGQPRLIRKKTVHLQVREPAGKVISQSFEIPYSDLGPLYKLAASKGRAAGWYAVTDASAGNALGIDQLLAAAKARSVEEFEQAVAGRRGITARLIAGDRHGKAMYIEAGPLLDVEDATLARCTVPGAKWVLDGSRSECLVRDASGAPRIAKAAAVPAVTTRGAIEFASTSYRYALFDRELGGYSSLYGDAREPPGARTLMSHRHLGEVLGDGRITPAEATDVMFSNRNYAAETTLDAILLVCKRAEERSRAARACKVLAAWDRTNNSDSRGALLFAQAWPKLQNIKDLYAKEFDASRPYDVLSISDNAKVSDAIISTLSAALESLESLGLRGDEPWGQMVARVTNNGRVPLHGGSADQGVLNVITPEPLQAQGYADIRYGSSYAHFVTWQNGELVADVLLAHGQSVDPASPHYSDQLPLFAAKKLVPMPFAEAQIRADPGYRVIRLRQ